MTTSNPLTLPVHVRTEIAPEAAQMAAALQVVNAHAIHDQSSFAYASDLLKLAKERWKFYEDRRTAVTGPLNAALREVNSWFKPVQEPYKQIEMILKSKIAQYTLAEKARAEQAMQQAAVAIQAGNAAAAAQHVAAMGPAPVAQGISVKEYWDFEVVDENAVPREFLSVDPRKIQAAIWYADTPHTPPRPIPGVRFFKSGSVTARTG